MYMLLGWISRYRKVPKAFPAFAPLVACLWLIGNSDFAFAQEKLPLLTRAEAVRSLSPNQAQLRYPVRLQGFVTYYDPDLPSLYIQDDSSEFSPL
jgi:hypothetical protein